VAIIPCLWDKKHHANEVERGEYHGDPFVPAPAEVRDDKSAYQGAKRVPTSNCVPKVVSATDNQVGRSNKHVYPHLCAAFVEKVQVLESMSATEPDTLCILPQPQLPHHEALEHTHIKRRSAQSLSTATRKRRHDIAPQQALETRCHRTPHIARTQKTTCEHENWPFTKVCPQTALAYSLHSFDMREANE
jgi:hypothetical protein